MSGRQGHPESQAGVQGFPGDVLHAQSSAVQSSGLTSSTTRPSGCPSAPTSRYTSGFPAEEDGSLAPPPLQARAAGRRSGKERGIGNRPRRRGPQRRASIAAWIGSGQETGDASGKDSHRGHRRLNGRVRGGRAPLPLLVGQAWRPRPRPAPSGFVRGRSLPTPAGNAVGLLGRRSVKSFEIHRGQRPGPQTGPRKRTPVPFCESPNR